MFLSSGPTKVSKWTLLGTLPRLISTCFPLGLNWLVVLQGWMGIIFKPLFYSGRMWVFHRWNFPMEKGIAMNHKQCKHPKLLTHGRLHHNVFYLNTVFFLNIIRNKVAGGVWKVTGAIFWKHWPFISHILSCIIFLLSAMGSQQLDFLELISFNYHPSTYFPSGYISDSLAWD